MSSEKQSLAIRAKDFIERLLALKVTESERVGPVEDPYGFFDQEISGKKPMRVAAVMAVVIHFILFMIVFPSWGSSVLEASEQLMVLKNLARPSVLAGGASKPEAAPPKPEPTVPEPKPVYVPIPDPTPNEPEPIRKEVEETPPIIEQISAELNIGDITAPPGPPGRGGEGDSRNPGPGSGPVEGPGPAQGTGRGPYLMGEGIVNPEVIKKTIPSYTDEAIKAKVQGYVVIQAIIRRNGRVTDFKVIRGLGFGLEEKAIQEIASNWQFRPGTKDGRPVDVLAMIEVQFSLR
ncbi:MAG: energy transducer TonB [Acidobacteriota bacterium]